MHWLRQMHLNRPRGKLECWIGLATLHRRAKAFDTMLPQRSPRFGSPAIYIPRVCFPLISACRMVVRVVWMVPRNICQRLALTFANRTAESGSEAPHSLLAVNWSCHSSPIMVLLGKFQGRWTLGTRTVPLTQRIKYVETRTLGGITTRQRMRWSPLGCRRTELIMVASRTFRSSVLTRLYQRNAGLQRQEISSPPLEASRHRSEFLTLFSDGQAENAQILVEIRSHTVAIKRRQGAQSWSPL